MALLVLPEPAVHARADDPRVQIVNHRVDALVQAFRVKLDEKAIEELKKRGAIARIHGRASFTDKKNDGWELKVPRRGDGQIWRLRREDHVRLQIDPKAAGGSRKWSIPTEPVADFTQFFPERLASDIAREGPWKGVGPKPGHIERATFAPVKDLDPELEIVPGWTIELIWYAQFIARQKLRSLIDQGWEIASRFGEVQEDRLRRIDLCADIAGFQIGPDDYRNFSRKSHVKVFPFTEKPVGDDGFRNCDLEVREVDLPALADMIAEGTIAGIRVGSGDVVACVYDKRKHLKDTAPEDKIAAEESYWKAGGWNGSDPIARCEIRFRGDVLQELGARKPECVDPVTGEIVSLDRYVPRMWATFLKWLRLTKPSVSKTGKAIAMARRRTDPRWAALSRIDWLEEGCDHDPVYCTCKDPIRRIRLRGGASAAQALGAMVSTVGAAGRLDEMPPASEDAADYADAPNEKLKALLAILTNWGLDVIASALIDRWGSPESAAAHLAIIMNASRARFEKNARAGPSEKGEERSRSEVTSPSTRVEKQIDLWTHRSN